MLPDLGFAFQGARVSTVDILPSNACIRVLVVVVPVTVVLVTVVTVVLVRVTVVTVVVVLETVVVVATAPRTQARPWNPNADPKDPLQEPVPELPW